MKRTNSEKGLGVDPGWVAISWDEALDILEEKLTKVRKEDPRKLVFSTFDGYNSRNMLSPWAKVFGTPNTHWTGYYCGQNLIGPAWEWAPGEYEGLITSPAKTEVGHGADYYTYEIKSPETMDLSLCKG